MARGWAGKGSTTAWRRLRLRILDRDGWACQIRLPGVCKGEADCVHHTKGKERTGDDPAHLAAACTPCNLKLGEPKEIDPRPKSFTQW